MKQPYMPPRNRGHFVQDMPPRRVNWLAFWRLAFDVLVGAALLTLLDLTLHAIGWL
jgi:hypothetical protein